MSRCLVATCGHVTHLHKKSISSLAIQVHDCRALRHTCLAFAFRNLRHKITFSCLYELCRCSCSLAVSFPYRTPMHIPLFRLDPKKMDVIVFAFSISWYSCRQRGLVAMFVILCRSTPHVASTVESDTISLCKLNFALRLIYFCPLLRDCVLGLRAHCCLREVCSLFAKSVRDNVPEAIKIPRSWTVLSRSRSSRTKLVERSAETERDHSPVCWLLQI